MTSPARRLRVRIVSGFVFTLTLSPSQPSEAFRGPYLSSEPFIGMPLNSHAIN